MQPLVGTLYQLIDQARSTPVKRFRGMVAPGAGAKKPFKKKKKRGLIRPVFTLSLWAEGSPEK